MTMARALILALCLLVMPVSGQGWFDDLRLEIRPKHIDASELRTLLSTLVPDVYYESAGEGFVVRGERDELDQIQELVAEVDRPLDEVFVDVRGFTLTSDGLEHLGVRSSESFKQFETGDGRPSKLWHTPYPRTHPNPQLPYLVSLGEAEPLFQSRFRVTLGSQGTVELPGESVDELFGSSELRLKVEAAVLTNRRLKANVRFETPAAHWSVQTRLGDGNPLVVGGPSKKRIILVTLYMMR